VIDGERVENSVSIPIREQEVIFQIPYFGFRIPKGSSVDITAVPYFFNASTFGALRFDWNVEDARKSGETTQNIITLNIEKSQSLRGSYIPVQVTVINTESMAERAENRINLLIQ